MQAIEQEMEAIEEQDTILLYAFVQFQKKIVKIG